MSSHIGYLRQPLSVLLAVLITLVGVAGISACDPDSRLPTSPHVTQVRQPHPAIIGATVVVLPTLGGPYGSTWAYAINDAGQVAGFSATREGAERAFLWTPGQGMQDLGTLGGFRSEAYAINNAGQVVGTSSVGTEDRAFLWTPGRGMQDLGTVGGRPTSIAYGINDAGQVVGDAYGGATLTTFFWSAADGMEDLYLATGLPDAQGINNRGQIAGYDRVVTLQFANRAPVAVVGGPYTGQKKKSVAFDGMGSSDPDGDLLTYSWDFGDDSPRASGPTPVHEYGEWGTYTVTLTMSDPAGLFATQTTTATIAPPGHLKQRP